MQTKIHNFIKEANSSKQVHIYDLVKNSFNKIAPFWPLNNLIAVNPLQGLEDLPIENALNIGAEYFQQRELPQPMLSVNRETIKWLQAFFDDGQATICMPNRKTGLYNSWRSLVVYDKNLHKNLDANIKWLHSLPSSPDQAIAECLLRLSITKEEREQFLTLMLTTLPGWSSYIKYITEWADIDNKKTNLASQSDYLAIRLIITTLLWIEGKHLLDWHKKCIKTEGLSILNEISMNEVSYRTSLLKNIATQQIKRPYIPDAQLVFCIDVRSELFRTNLESLGNYQTFGYAGFFGLPVQITDAVTENFYASCPVLIKPKHDVKEYPCDHKKFTSDKNNYLRIINIKKVYQSVKYNFTAPFALVETLGVFCSIWMGLKCLSPKIAAKIKSIALNTIRPYEEVSPSIDGIPFSQQCIFAERSLKMIGLTKNFSPIIVFCGHGSTTYNNAYATALNCGACGSHHGASNARILAKILNRSEVRAEIAKSGIYIPKDTKFIAAGHDTTTDEVTIYGENKSKEIQKLINDLKKATVMNNKTRLKNMGTVSNIKNDIQVRSQDWSEVRPEWGLARNCAFIVSPRDMTAELKLDGRCFLHSYDYNIDPEGEMLTTILTAPMIVAHWINMQYLFSTFDNVSYGAGSKITHNITGKIGVMQGNASDLMTGLPLQSIYSSDNTRYHELQRLLTVVYAPLAIVDQIVNSQEILKKLFSNGWLQISVIEPCNRKIFILNRDLSWQEIS